MLHKEEELHKQEKQVAATKQQQQQVAATKQQQQQVAATKQQQQQVVVTKQTAAGGAGGGGGGATAGGSTINILEGSSIQGSPDYDPDELTASAGAEVTVVNQDTVLHSATSGTGPQDPESAQQFDTSLINAGESATLSLAQVTPGQYDYYCIVHPYMTGKIVVQ